MNKCRKCGKSTRSHKVGAGTFCHGCYQSLTENEISELVIENRKEKSNGLCKALTMIGEWTDSDKVTKVW